MAPSFRAQCIPTDPELQTLEAYRAFTARRRELVAARLNEFLGVAAESRALGSARSRVRRGRGG